MSIIIVDDSMVSRHYIADLLRDAGYSGVIICDSVEDAYQAIDFAPDNDHESDVDLILLDINLPGKSGIDACQELTAHPTFGDIPIIVISGTDHLEGLDAAFAAGAMDYITKPPNHTELLARVRSALRLKSEMDRRKAREDELLILNERLAEVNYELEKLSVTDSLTGLANRRYFNEFIAREWKRGLRDQAPFSVLMIDIDHFKDFNDHYGHLEGDVCLKKVSWALQCSIQRAGDLLARYGGEEFIAVLPQTDAEGAAEIAEEFHQKVAELALPHQASPVAATVTISIGLATAVPAEALSPSQLVAQADEALYRAKQTGRNRTASAA